MSPETRQRAASAASVDDSAGRLQLLSCNILAGGSVTSYREYVTQSWKHMLPMRSKRGNLDRFAKVLSEFDLVGLQEADAGSLRSGFLNQTQYLAEAAGFPYWSHQPNRKIAQFAASSNGLLTRMEPSEVLDYPLPSRIPGRGALWVRFGEGDNALVVLIAHLSLSAAARKRQIEFLGELIGDAPNVVLMGDLNCTAKSAEMRSLFRRTSLAPPDSAPPTFPSWEPTRAIDHIIVSSGMRVEEMWTLPHPVSDHLPIAARVRLPIAMNRAA
jgi:endonuclease/exonuclease/phosphatase family metal-dependent hydrolase